MLPDKIKNLYALSNTSLVLIEGIMQQQRLPKGHLLFTAGQVSRKIYFLTKGTARAFNYQNNKEVTFWLGFEGDMVISYHSYVAGKPGYENIELLEDAELYVIEQHELQVLYQTHIDIANWGRKLAEYELIRTEQRFIAHQFYSAKDRYLTLIQQHPEMVQRIQLGYIASFLGISQVTLSRIRAEVAKS